MVLLQSGCDHTVSCAFEIYIPIWFYFNSTSAVRSIFKVLIYIPIWFYFNTTRRLNILSWRHLHSNMVLLQSTADHHHQTLFFIYIPIWFYFNIDFFNSCFFLTSFTFQYGSTSIKLACRRNNVFSGIYIPIWFYFNSSGILINPSLSAFTFQYGSTSIPCQSHNLSSYQHLHSNMVLLQLCSAMISFLTSSIYIPIWFYFNDPLLTAAILSILIYIPIWFYFNLYLFSDIVPSYFIYIPIWFYFN